MCKQDYYQILRLNQNATEQDIKTAFIKLSFQYHPELNPGKENKNRFKEIYAAYIILRDGHFVQGLSIQALDCSLESILYDLLEIGKDASEQDIDKVISNLACQYRPILKDLGYRSIMDLSEEDAKKLKKLYKAYTMLKQKAKRREYEGPNHDEPSQMYAGDETSFDLSLEDILYQIRGLVREVGIDFDEKSIDPLGILPFGKEVVHEFYKISESLLSDVLGIRIKGKVRGR
jgi:DnaJ-class molecular chaperone